MPNQDALTLAKVAIDAGDKWGSLIRKFSERFDPIDDPGPLEDFIAAAIDRHMEPHDVGMREIAPIQDGGNIIGTIPLYRITQEPRGGEDGD